MSLVTSAVFAVMYAPARLLDALTQPLPFDEERHQAFRKISTEHAGGTKLLSGDVYAAGLNYVEPSRLVDWAMSLPWEEWDMATLTWSGEDYGWGVVIFRGTDVTEQRWAAPL